MDRIADFNISSNRQRHRNTNSCNVVINNNHSVTSAVQRRVKPRSESQYGLPPLPPKTAADKQNVVYPSVTPTFAEPSPYEADPPVIERDVTLAESEPLNGNELDLFKTIAKTFGEILRDNNPKLVANLIDQSGKVIVDAERLVRIVALVCQAHPESINIEYEVKETGCCGKLNPIKNIEAIKVAGLDFKLTYNEKYNMLTDQYSISLRKVLIPIDELL